MHNPGKTDGHNLPIFRTLVVAGITAIAALLTLATPAQAHNYYVSSTPTQDEILTKLPEEFTVTTNDNLLDLGGGSGGFIMEVIGPDGSYFGDGCVSVSGPAMSMAAALGPSGNYTLNWQAISADGHTVSGEIAFQWQPAEGQKLSSGTQTPPKCGEAPAPTEVQNTPDLTTQAPQTAQQNQATQPNSESASTFSDVLWIGGAILAVAIAAITTLLILSRTKAT